MEFNRLQNESKHCLKFKQIEDLVEHNKNKKYGLLVVNNQYIHAITRVTTTNQEIIFHVGEVVGNVDYTGMHLDREYTTNAEATNLDKIVVKNGKSMYITNGTEVYEAATIQFDTDTIILGIGGLVGKLVYDSKDLKKLQESKKSGDSWFNYN